MYRDPLIDTDVILVVAGLAEVHAVRRAQFAQCDELVAELVDRSIDEIAGERDQIRP